jgi:hypothetical protein
MAIAVKKKRKIIINDRIFYWCVKKDSDSASLQLHISSLDKKFLIHYNLGQTKGYASASLRDQLAPFVVVLGSEFGGLQPAGFWRRVRGPVLDDDAIMTPHFVRRLIEWCLDEHKEVVLTDCQGQASRKLMKK